MTTATDELTRQDLARRVAEAAMSNGGDPRAAARNVASGIAGNPDAAQRWWRAIGRWAALTAYREMRRGWTNGHEHENGGEPSDVPENWGTSRFDGVDPLELPKAVGNTGEHKPLGAWTREDVAEQVHFLSEIHATVGRKIEAWEAVHEAMGDGDTLAEALGDLPSDLRDFVEHEAGM